MSEDNKIPPPPPPDDFTKTTPNIALPKSGDEGSSDWEKTNYNLPNQPSADEWGKTITNLRPIDTDRPDLDKTYFPGSGSSSPTPDWGMTESNVNAADLGTRPEDFGPADTYNKTVPYFRLPEAERAKYQNLPPTASEKAAAEEAEMGQSGVPGWVWVAAGAMTLAFLAIVTVGVVYIFILRDSSYEVTVKEVPIGGRVTVDGAPISLTSEDGNIKLLNLKAGSHQILVKPPSNNFRCKPMTVEGENGSKKVIDSGCVAEKAAATDDCVNFKQGDDEKAERCYNSALDALPDPFTPEDLVRALNILIINFASGSSEVPEVRRQALKKGAGFIQKLPSSVVLEVGGHTDNVGQPASNQTLSESRAAAVKDLLVRFGVRADALQIRGYGATQPRPDADNNTETGRYRNRRIAYSIVKK